MGRDDAADYCAAGEHQLVLTEMELGDAGATMHYECRVCEALLVRGPGELFPK